MIRQGITFKSPYNVDETCIYHYSEFEIFLTNNPCLELETRKFDLRNTLEKI